MKRTYWLPIALVVGFYLITHLYQLTALPVFADEAIYIRWAQLIIDDWKQYLFFPLNDGKTPLHMWLMVPLLLIGKDPLFMARMLSVVAGIAQMFVTAAIIRTLGGKRTAALVGMILTAILPFWYFHHRMALIDALVCLWLSLTLWGLLKLSQQPRLKWSLITGAFFGLSLLTKLPAILLAPAFPLYPFFFPHKQTPKRMQQWVLVALSGVVGLGFFFALKIHPAFSQLFSRGGDFLFPWRDVLFHGGWQTTLGNIPRYTLLAIQYLTWPVLALNLFGLFSPDENRRKTHHALFWSAVFFAGPMVLLGKVVYPRYFLPISIFLTPGAALALETLVRRYVHQSGKIWKQIAAGLLVAFLVTNTVSTSAVFMFTALSNPALMPFVPADKEQYVYEWSSGHGIRETVADIQNVAQTQTIAVATEGSFGTLPDGILMYLHNQDVTNIYVEGIGFPVKSLSPEFTKRAASYDQVWLVVNSHRLEFSLPKDKLIREYCRPHEAPCLQIWDVSELVKN